jgi:type II secretory pathway pseudopilin PulG
MSTFVLPRRAASRTPPLAAFTLVELLVVIGIIAILISILIPTLNRARESAQRTQCLSNLRQMAVLLNMYANANRQQVPLGAMSGGTGACDEGNNYFISRESNSPDPETGPPGGVRWIGLGLFIKAGYIKEIGGGSQNAGSALIFFCPSAQGDIWHGFDAPNNKWPPSKNTVRCSYSSRSSTQNPDPQPGTHATDVVAWGYAKDYPWYPVKVKDSKFEAAVAGVRPKADMFKLDKLKNRAILSDVLVGEDRVRLVHKKGFNVLYANGGAKWLDLKLVTPQFGKGAVFGSGNGNWILHQIWNNMDAEQQLYP